MSVYTYYKWTADQDQPVKLQLRQHRLTFLPAYVCFLYNDSLQYRTPPTLPTSRNVTLKPSALYGAALVSVLQIHYYNLQLTAATPFAPSPHYRSHILPIAHIYGGLAVGNVKLQLSVKMLMQSVHDSYIGVCVRALFLHYLAPIILPQILVLLFPLYSNIIAFCYSK